MKDSQNSDAAAVDVLEIADLRVEPGIRRVTRGGQDVPLPGLTFDLLMALIRGAPNLLSADRLIEEVWKGQVVSPETVTQRVKLLRDALGDDSQNPRYVAGARGQGYRLIPEVVPLRKSSARRSGIRPPVIRLVAGLLIVLSLGIAAAAWRSRKAAPRDDPARPASIAVLPFENRSVRQEDAFFAEGIHDELLTRLSRMSGVRVIARGSVAAYQPSRARAGEIARELGVGTIVRGAVQRAGDQVRIHVQLIDGRHDEQIWAETYDRALTLENVLAIQTEISTAIATKLQIAVSPADRANIQRPLTSDLAAYESWLKARQEMNRYTPAGLAAAVLHYQEAIAADPEFTLALVGLSEARLLQWRFRTLGRDEALELAQTAVERALAIDPASAEAFAVKGDILRLQGHPASAESSLRRAIAINPNLASAYLTYGWLLMDQGRTAEQMDMWRRAGLLDPRSTVAGVHRAFTDLRQGRIVEADARLREVLERDPQFPLAHVVLGEVNVARGYQAEAVRAYRRALELNRALPMAHGGLVGALLDLEADDEVRVAIAGAADVHDVPGLVARLELTATTAGAASEPGDRRDLAAAIAEVRPFDPIAAAQAAAFLHLREGRSSDARAELEAAESRLTQSSTDWMIAAQVRSLPCTYAFVLVRLGEVDRGRAIARALVERDEKNAGYGRQRQLEPVACHAVLGDLERVVTTLRAAGSVPGGWRALMQRPELAEMRKAPEIIGLIDTIRAEAASQRASLRNH